MLVNAVEEFIQNGSNYQLYSIKGMKIDIDVYRPLGGSSYIDLPPYIKNKVCVLILKITMMNVLHGLFKVLLNTRTSKRTMIENHHTVNI